MPEQNLKHDFATLDDVRMHYVTCGDGFPVLLLHGWPQTWYEWRHIIPILSQSFRVIAPDLRGLGDTSRPTDGYDKRTVAKDVWELMNDHLKLQKFHVVGHDWGGPTAYALATAHSDSVERLAILDVVIPGDGADGFSQGGRRWHHAFHMTPDIPEALTTGRERTYLEWFYRTFAHKSEVFSEDDINEYLRCYTSSGGMTAGFAYYRALPQDITDNEETIKNVKLKMPVLAVGGANAKGRGNEVGQSLRRVADDVTEVVIDDCGHFIPEEQPEILARHLRAFFGANK